MVLEVITEDVETVDELLLEGVLVVVVVMLTVMHPGAQEALISLNVTGFNALPPISKPRFEDAVKFKDASEYAQIESG